jgi:hypothetical protein
VADVVFEANLGDSLATGRAFAVAFIDKLAGAAGAESVRARHSNGVARFERFHTDRTSVVSGI